MNWFHVFLDIVIALCGVGLGWEARRQREVWLRRRERGRLREILATELPRNGQTASAPRKGHRAVVKKADMSRTRNPLRTKNSEER